MSEIQLSKKIEEIRSNFPVLQTTRKNKPLVYLDNAATTQKPKCVAESLYHFYTNEYATIHRGIYQLSQIATQRVQETRKNIQKFLNASHTKEIIFTKGTTEAINLVASSYGQNFIKEGNEILITQLEHHANIIPWQIVAEKVNAKLKVIPMLKSGELDLEKVDDLLTENTALMALTHVSNALGTINPIQDLIKKAKSVNAKVLIDGAQAVSHIPIDVQALDCDFYTFSSHKLYGPTGVGVLYGKKELLEKMPPYQTGGDMIENVTFEKTTFANIPNKFEAGTPAIAEIIGLGEAIKYVEQIGFDTIQKQENYLLKIATEKLQDISGLKIIGNAKEKAGVISFELCNLHPHDVGTILDEQNVAIRAGHHCAQPIMTYYGVPATTRASFAVYNNEMDIDRLIAGLRTAKEFLT